MWASIWISLYINQTNKETKQNKTEPQNQTKKKPNTTLLCMCVCVGKARVTKARFSFRTDDTVDAFEKSSVTKMELGSISDFSFCRVVWDCRLTHATNS